MDELVAQISARTGLPADQARAAAQVMVDFLKARLPAPIAGQLDAILSGSPSGDTASQVQDLLGGLGGMFGKKG